MPVRATGGTLRSVVDARSHEGSAAPRRDREEDHQMPRQLNLCAPLFAAALLVSSLAACGDDSATGPRALGALRSANANAAAPALTISRDTARVVIGRTTRLDAALRDSFGQPQPAPALTWSSSDAKIATVDAA